MPMPASQRSRPQPTIADQLDRVIPDFDRLVSDVRLGHPLSPARYHELEARAHKIAADLIAAFRRPTNVPLAQQGGQAWW